MALPRARAATCFSDSTSLNLAGILLFQNTVFHEYRHQAQIAVADHVVANLAAAWGAEIHPWANGWSWNQGALHNHWSLGSDEEPGCAGDGTCPPCVATQSCPAGVCCSGDDDCDGGVNNLIATGPGELGAKGILCDSPLFDLGDPAFDWPKALGVLPDLVECGIGDTPIERDARSSALMNENLSARSKDWSDMGYQFFGSPSFRNR